jgi:hypothetical protein
MTSTLRRGEWRLLCLWLSALLGLLLAPQVLAHGAEESMIQVQDASLGDYRLTVRTAPRTLLVGPLHVLVQVTGSTGRPQVLQSLRVAVQPVPSSGDGQITQALPMLPPGTHEAQLTLPHPGEYQITLRLNDNAEEITFAVVALSGIWMQGTLLALSSVTGVAALWLVKEGFTVWRRKP